MARPRRQLDFRSVAEALTDPSLERASMDGVARHLGVAKPTLYRMAGSREELISLSIDAEAERLLERIHRGGLPGFFAFVRDSPAGFVLLFGDRYPEARQAVRRVEHRLGSQLGESTVTAAGLLGLVAGIARRTIEDADSAEPERLGSDFDLVANVASRIADAQS